MSMINLIDKEIISNKNLMDKRVSNKNCSRLTIRDWENPEDPKHYIYNKMRYKEPEDYIKRLFGKSFEFTEQYLISNIEPALIIQALKKRYKFDKITRVTIKHVLYEGARSNNILRINNQSFERLVDILNLPLDREDDYNFEEDKNEESRS
jgi:hypothetical protein